MKPIIETESAEQLGDFLPGQRSEVSEAIGPDSAAIFAFLETIGQGLHLCSIVPDGACAGAWFGDDVVTATDWAVNESHNGKNVYWTVNLAVDGCHKKPSKADIVAARFVHIDIDPPKRGGPFDKLKTQADLGALPVPPSLIVDSGGGLQAFWRLAGPASLIDVEAANRSLAHLLGGDNCYNIDRLMRLPGTVNYPDARKCAAGRTTSLAKVIYDADHLLH